MLRKLQIKSTNWSFPIQDEGCFICIDKPKGPTSHQIDYWVRTLTGIERVGHIGTLDPQATGLLVVALGKAVRLVDIAHEYPKEYVGSMKLHGDCEEEKIRDAFRSFVGELYQLPPIKSAVSRKLRSRRIYDLQILEIRSRDILFKVRCQSGTYIRTLCLDIGYYLGTKANMTDLRRVSTGPFKEGMAITLQQLSDKLQVAKNGNEHPIKESLYQTNFLLSEFSKVVVKSSALKNIAHGSDIFPGGVKAIIGEPLLGDRVAVISETGMLVGTGKMLASFNQISDTKLVDLDRVLIDPEKSSSPRQDILQENPKIKSKRVNINRNESIRREKLHTTSKNKNYSNNRNGNRRSSNKFQNPQRRGNRNGKR